MKFRDVSPSLIALPDTKVDQNIRLVKSQGNCLTPQLRLGAHCVFAHLAELKVWISIQGEDGCNFGSRDTLFDASLKSQDSLRSDWRKAKTGNMF